jgi:hypothetical protein
LLQRARACPGRAGFAGARAARAAWPYLGVRCARCEELGALFHRVIGTLVGSSSRGVECGRAERWRAVLASVAAQRMMTQPVGVQKPPLQEMLEKAVPWGLHVSSVLPLQLRELGVQTRGS